MAVDDDDPRHRATWLRGGVQVGGDEHARPALEDDILDAVTITIEGARHAQFQILWRIGKLAERPGAAASMRLVAKVLPLGRAR